MIKYILAVFLNLLALTFCFLIQYVNFSFLAHQRNNPDAVAPWSPVALQISFIGFYVLMILYAFLSYKIFNRIRNQANWVKKIPSFFYAIIGFGLSIMLMTAFAVTIVSLISKGYSFIPGV